MPIRVVIVDHHRIAREGLRVLLNAAEDIEVVGDAADESSGISMATELQPTVVIVDLSTGDAEGLEFIRRLCSERPELHVVVLSSDKDAASIRLALQAGASAYLHVDCGIDEAVNAVRAVSRGQVYLSPSIASAIVDALLTCEIAGDGRDLDGLTQRDRQILQMLADGQTAASIASKLGLSVKTIEAHRRTIMNKLGVDSTAGLVKYAIRSGLVAVD